MPDSSSVVTGPKLAKVVYADIGANFPNSLRALLRMLDQAVQASVLSVTVATPPGSPANGDAYIVASSPTGAWSGQAGKIAVWSTQIPTTDTNTKVPAWEFYAPNAGWMVFNVADSAYYSYSGSVWAALGLASVTSVFGRGGVVVAATNDYSFSQISGVAAASQLPNPSASTLGGIESLASASHKWINAISTAGVPAATQPALLDLSDVPASYSGAGGKAVEVNSGATALVFSAKPYDIGFTIAGLGSNAQLIWRAKPVRAVTFPAGAGLSLASASANATGSTTYTYKKNGTSFATVNFAAGAAVGTWTQASDATFNGTSDLLEIDGPATADATLADVGITLAGVRS